MNARAVYLIARMEFVRLLTHPFVIATGLFLLLIAGLDGATIPGSLRHASTMFSEDMTLIGFGTPWQTTVQITTVMAAFLAATAIPYESWRNSLGVLLTKPLSRSDIVLGKFVGLAGFMFMFNALIVLFTGLTIIIFYQEPQSAAGFVLRVTTYILLYSLITALIIALNLFFGTISKNLLFVTAMAVTYFFVDWIWFTDRIGALSTLTPMILFNKILDPFLSNFTTLFDSLVPFHQWLCSAIPYIGLALVETSVLLLAGIYMFSRRETT